MAGGYFDVNVELDKDNEVFSSIQQMKQRIRTESKTKIAEVLKKLDPVVFTGSQPS